MSRMFGARNASYMYWKQLRLPQTRPYCTKDKDITTSKNNGGSDHNLNGSPRTTSEVYRQLENLDFMTAAKILFTTPPKIKKFGIDFHLVQLFFACMPSLAVYLVAQYARHEMKRMEAEQEVKRKAEEAKTKEIELKASQEEEAKTDPKLLEVKQRLDKLEETLKEIVVVSKRQGVNNITKIQSDSGEVKHRNVTDERNKSSRSEAPSSATIGQSSKQSSEDVTPSSSKGETNTSTSVATEASQHDPKETRNKGSANE